MSEVARVKTPVTAGQLYGALERAWPSVVGGVPSRGALLVLLAQSAFETGAWKSLYNYNFGNVKHTAADGLDFFVIRCDEYINGQHVWIDRCMFRSYPHLDAGAVAFLTALYKRFHSAWPAVEAGDPQDFAYRLKRAGYFTGDVNAYAGGLKRYFNEFSGVVSEAAAAVATTVRKNPLSSALGLFTALVLGGWGYLAWKRSRR